MALLALLICLFGGSARAAVIEKILIEGNRALAEETVRSFIGSREGAELNADQVTADIHSLYRSGFIEDVLVETRWIEGPGRPQLALVFIIREKPMIREVRFEGVKKLNEDDLKRISADLKARSVYDPVKVREVRAKLLDEYAKQGHFMARVEVEVKEVRPGQVEVIFWVEEGKRPVVRDIHFFGNQAFSDRKLRRVMTTKREGVFTAEKYSREDFLRDQYVLDFYYGDHGYLESSFTPAEKLLSEDREYVELGLGIEEGPQYFVGGIEVRGDLILAEEEIKRGFWLKPGEVFKKSYLLRDQQYLMDLYGTEGYALALVEPRLRLDREALTVDLTWEIRRGPKVYIERIEVTGNEKTYDKVVRRELLVKEGQLFSGSQTRRSEAQVRRLGYFSEVQIIPRRGSDENRVNLEVAVKEARSGSLSAGGGMSTADEYFFTLQYQQHNFLGLGLDMSVQAMVSDRTQTYYFRYADPYFLDSNWHLGLALFSTQVYYIRFIDQRQGGDLTIGRRVPHFDHLRFYLTYSYLTTDLESMQRASSIYRMQPSHTAVGSMTFTLDYNALNSYIDPSAGSRVRGSVQVAGYGIFGGDNDFVKTSLEAWHFSPLPADTYLMLRGRVRWLAYEKKDWLLISERFFQGGARSLRGYEVGSVSPVFREDSGYLTPFGGNKDLLFTVEYVVPIAPELGMKAAVFYDAGNVYNDHEDLDMTDLLQNWGFGLRWMSPMGPLRFELAFPIDPRPGDDSQQFVFSIGTIF